jgi:hypothetical protein
MARFKNKDIFFQDYDMAIFGTEYDSTLFWDGVNEDLRLTTVISGVYPFEPGHLTTKEYVDLGDIDTFLELTDTPTTYSGYADYLVTVNPTETGLMFSDVGSVLSGTISHSSLLNLDSDDHLQYVPRDGSRGFTSTVSGVYPVEDYHLATKFYVDEHAPSAEQILFGLQFHYNEYLPEQQTNSTTYVEALGMVISGTQGTGVNPGDYRVGWTFEWRQDRLNYEVLARVQVDDTITIYTFAASPYVDVNYFATLTDFFYVEAMASGVHYIDIDFASSDIKATSIIKNVRLEFWRVA